jgi:hypothetical protein
VCLPNRYKGFPVPPEKKELGVSTYKWTDCLLTQNQNFLEKGSLTNLTFSRIYIYIYIYIFFFFFRAGD